MLIVIIDDKNKYIKDNLEAWQTFISFLGRHRS